MVSELLFLLHFCFITPSDPQDLEPKMIVLEVKVDLTIIPLLQISSEFPVKSGGPEQEAQNFHSF